jgi:hypothetical protein
MIRNLGAVAVRFLINLERSGRHATGTGNHARIDGNG